MYFLIPILILIILTFTGAFFAAVWLPTKKEDFDRITKLAGLRPGMLFYDLGSGDGELLFYLSKKYNVNCVGIEISPLLFLYSKIKSLFYKNVKIYYGDFYKYDLSKADIVYIFLLPKSYARLRKKLETELRKDVKIILSSWPFEDCEPNQIDKKEKAFTYYSYITKENGYL
ncbi:MAG: class I SAM-dependent methyltransferase [bacterium]|nr:class I SAM-dependent methyltransferase [bacterium]